MGYFPLFVELAGRRVLVAGGGQVALRKVRKLLPYEPELTVAAPRMAPELEALEGIRRLYVPFSPELLDGAALVIAATDDAAVNGEISGLCRERGIPVNVVDTPEACTFLFPALVKRGHLSVGISTEGASPTAAAYLREQVEALVPERMGEILELLGGQRAAVQAALPEERQRAAFLRGLFLRLLRGEIPLTEEAAARELRAYQREERERT